MVLTTLPDESGAKQIATTLVHEGLAACVNVIAGVTSIYSWKEEVTVDSECLLIIKTTQEGLPPLESRLSELHPYEVPEFIVLQPDQVGASYLKWVMNSVVPRKTEPREP